MKTPGFLHLCAAPILCLALTSVAAAQQADAPAAKRVAPVDYAGFKLGVFFTAGDLSDGQFTPHWFLALEGEFAYIPGVSFTDGGFEIDLAGFTTRFVLGLRFQGRQRPDRRRRESKRGARRAPP